MGFKRNGASTLHRYEYGYDANGNRTYAKINQAGHPNDRSFLYGYDNLNRLVYAERGVLDTSVPVIDNGGTGRAWNLDVLGNWSGDQTNQRSVIDYTFSSGNPGYSSSDTVTAYTHHDTDATNQIVQHRYDATPQTPSSVATTDFHYDKAGNVILDNEHFYKYDAWNRVARVSERGTLAVSGDTFTGAVGDLLSIFFYDALGRRINKRVYNSEALNTTGYGDYFYYDGHRVLEHRKTNAAGTAVEPHRRYVYGLDYIDEVVAYYDTGAADPDPHFVLQDANYDVVGVTDHQGYLQQQYSYAPYGAYQHIEDGSGVRYNEMDADLTELLIPLGRNGLILDRETGLYYNRARYYDPLLSRFLQADPNGTGLVASGMLLRNGSSPGLAPAVNAAGQYADGMNVYEYALSGPSYAVDPRGLGITVAQKCMVLVNINHEEDKRWLLTRAESLVCSAWGNLVCHADKYNRQPCKDEEGNDIVDEVTGEPTMCDRPGLIPNFPSITTFTGPGKGEEEWLPIFNAAKTAALARGAELAEDCECNCKRIAVVLKCNFRAKLGDTRSKWYREECPRQSQWFKKDGTDLFSGRSGRIDWYGTFKTFPCKNRQAKPKRRR